MSRLVVCGIIALTLAAPAGLLAAPAPVKAHSHEAGTITGEARDAADNPLANAKVRIRNANGTVVSELRSATDGSFIATGLQPDTYFVEVLGSNGTIIGLSPAITVAAGTTATVAVSATAAGAMAAAGAGGVSVFGLGTAATVGVLGAAAVGGFVAIKAVTNDASPSK